MDQIKIGQFIATMRKEQTLTQRELADILSISDKTVSKWECGKGLPEVSLMLPLCSVLHITVNDLLSGGKIAETDYRKQAEENMMSLMKENEENKKRMAMSVICGIITIIAVVSLVVIASYQEMPTAARIGILVLPVVTAGAGIVAAAMLEVRAGYYECPHCYALFIPTMNEYVKGIHTLTRRKLTCHECGKTGMCRHRIVR